jgi:hypothetical protein
LEKEHYGEIMEKFLTVNKNFLSFLVQDEHYGENLALNDEELDVDDILNNAQKMKKKIGHIN